MMTEQESKDVVVYQHDRLRVTKAQQDIILRSFVSPDATPDEVQLFFYDCARRGVHPMDRLLHFSKRSGRYVPITSIDYMRQRAEASGCYAGSDDAVFAEYSDKASKYPEAATVTVWKRFPDGQRFSFTATARWNEYAPTPIDGSAGFMWRKMPHTMLAKCAEALALRKAFPGELAGLYESSELDQAISTKAVSQIESEQQSEQAGSTQLEPDPDPKDWPVDFVTHAKEVWEANGILAKGSASKHVIMLLNLLDMPLSAKDSELLRRGGYYREQRAHGLSTKAAAAATLDQLNNAS